MADLTPKKLLQRKPKDGITTAAKPKDADPLAVEIRKRWTDGTNATTQELFDYYLNYQFIEGNQWLWFNTEQRRLEEVPRDPERVRLTVNRMRANSRTIIGKTGQREMTFEVLPTDADDSHLRGAKLAESQLEVIRLSHDWEQKRELTTWSAWKGGYAAIGVMWDPNAGDPAASPDDTGGVERKQGDTIEVPLNASEFTVEPGSKDAEHARWWATNQLLPPKEVQDRYDLEWEPAADGMTATTPFLMKLTTATGAQLANTPLTQVITLYERPNVLCPKGQIVCVVNDQVVFKADWPYPFTDRLNFALIRETPMENRWTGTTVVTDARPIQTALNQSWSNIVEHMKRAGNARLTMPQSAVDMMDDMSDLPGEVLPFPDGAEKPGWISPPGMPDWWIRQPGDLAGELDDVMGVHPVTRGEAPTNVESGYGLSILAEHDATPTERLVKETAIAWSKVATMVLKIYEVEVKVKRESLVAIPGQSPRSISWSGEDFRGQTTAIIPQDAILPRSRAAQLQFAKDAMQMGLITSLADFALVAELPGSRQLLEGTNPDLARARRENAGYASGHQSVPYEWDDHEAHLIEHNRYRKSLDYELLPEDVKKLIEQHVQAHVTMAAEKIGAQQSAHAIGGPGLAGAPTVAGPAPDPMLNPPFTGTPMPQDPNAAAAPAPAEGPAEDPEAEKAAVKKQVFNELMQQINQPNTGAPQ